MMPLSTIKFSESTSQGSVDPMRPLAEMGLSETAHNVTWSNCSNRTLLASMNLKYIKIFDLRGKNGPLVLLLIH